MKFYQTPLDAYVIEPDPFADHRGKFSRIFCRKELEQIGFQKEIVQINHSMTVQKGAVRGMHFQKPPKAEIKFVRCIRGAVFDVVTDLRHDSPTMLQWHGEVLSAENMKMMVVPEGFAHGFQTIEENSEIIYFVTETYSPEYEGGIRYNDPVINISWPLEITDISEKDQNHPLLSQDFKGINV
ncbi:MAG: dTDP-4-dehydrorhamnose 3,5-epimerase [Deltaproteobacteria bacterium]|nr:MAG: dTDP-4-dehydrorhamnose 3,5-epimerase [Deltaproteobacteria bacterium]